MENKKALSFVFIIIAIILGAALWKQFDFENLRFEKPALAAIYFITFAVSISLLVRDYKNRSKN
ncbi:hypothetical protein [Moheibacter sediminis]|uniref:ATP synthase F0 sector subunit C n=1 Tax=Moheibacter sediminis TaxID=1434700 RepID=A0A1W2CFQ1_9FLAO|nr:hypothetical protein [Moheibacter sediminis]SMC83989.1 hypothetical protein SAMN06296427_11027 [Moheibacter sediminis]